MYPVTLRASSTKVLELRSRSLIVFLSRCYAPEHLWVDRRADGLDAHSLRQLRLPRARWTANDTKPE